MNDLERHLAELNELEAPDLRPAIEQRAARLRQRSELIRTVQPEVALRRGLLVAAGTAIAILLVVAAGLLVAPGGSNELADALPARTPGSSPPVVGGDAGPTVSVTVTGVTDHLGHELAGVLYTGEDLLDLDADALGGFWAVIDNDDFATTEVIRTPGPEYVGRFPFVTDTALTIEPGTYTLVVWVDHALGSSKRWVPINTDGQGLYGCHHTFDVDTDAQTAITVPANLQPDGWNVDCITGTTTPGTNAATAVAPEFDPWEDLPAAMDPITGLDAGPTVSVTVTGVTDHLGHELAGVLYTGEDLLDLDADALGGFWAVIDNDDFATTEVIRTPGPEYVGRFPFVTDTALTIEPGTYTLVVWVDHALGSSKRWVPINTDGQGLYGCHHTFDVDTDAQTAITVPANLQPDGWNVDCITGTTTPGTNAATAVAPEFDPWEDLPAAMDPITGLDAGPTVSVTVTGVTDHLGHELAGVLYTGEDLLDLDADALGGFWAVIDNDDFATTEVIRTPGPEYVGRFPFVTDTALTIEPGTYTLVVWVDHALGSSKRWVPINTDGQGLYGCHHTFDVDTDAQTAITVPANLQPDGWNVDCITGTTTPGTNAATAVAPEFDPWEDLPAAMDPITGLDAGPTVSVTVTGVTDHLGHELAGVLYTGEDLLDLDADALGGFWAVIDNDDFATTEVIRTPGPEYVGRFPFVTDTALTIEPGTYTLVVWVDHALGSSKRWVPINTDGQGLYGCHHTFDVDTDAQTAITVPANLQPDGWNVDCITGTTTPGTNAATAVAP